LTYAKKKTGQPTSFTIPNQLAKEEYIQELKRRILHKEREFAEGQQAVNLMLENNDILGLINFWERLSSENRGGRDAIQGEVMLHESNIYICF
jgi:hypothetical protein